jgi:hypothetical protein
MRFYGCIEGNGRTKSTRGGNVNSGISAHIRGWDSGIRIAGWVNDDGEDVFEIVRTGGSNDSGTYEIIGRIVGGGSFEPTDSVVVA